VSRFIRALPIKKLEWFLSKKLEGFLSSLIKELREDEATLEMSGIHGWQLVLLE
jgi:hypothetical protein